MMHTHGACSKINNIKCRVLCSGLHWSALKAHAMFATSSIETMQ